MKKTIVVFGVTGTQGGSVAAQYLNSPDWHIRGITRNASSPRSLFLSSQGIEIIEADLDTLSTLTNIFSGAHAIFLVTDFWAPYFSAPEHIKSSPSDKATAEYAYNVETTRGKRIADLAAKALADEGLLEHFIFSSLPDVKRISGGKYEYVFHFDSKAAIAKYVKDSLPTLQAKTSLLYMAFYMDNVKRYSGKAIGIQKSPDDDSYVFPTKSGAGTAHPFVKPEDTGIFVDLLLRTSPGKVLLGVGEYISWKDFAELWGEVNGKKARCKEMSIEEWDRELPGGFGREYAESSAFSEEFGWGAGDGGRMLLLPKDLDPNVKLTTVREYIEKEDWEPLVISLCK